MLNGNLTKYLFSKPDASDIWLAVRKGCRQFVGSVKVKPGHVLRWRDRVNIDPKEMGGWTCWWIDLAQDKGKRWGLVIAVINPPPVP